MNKAKIGILHPKFAGGGSESVALWVLSALKDDYDVSLITSGKVDLQQLNEYYGTNLDPKGFSIIRISMPFYLGNTNKLAALRGRLIQRYCQHLAPSFDLMVSTYDFCDFGTRGIQFIADFSFDEELRREVDLIPKDWKKWYHQDIFLRKIYLKFCDWISPFNSEVRKNDFVIANSNWTAGLIRKKYGIEVCIIYPPVTGNFPTVPFGKREKGFACISRVVPEKRIDTIIEILERVRQRGYNIHLHIVGGIPDDHYGKSLKKIFQKHREWIFLEGWLGEKKKKEMIAKHRFGISGCRNESFGIAVAEMVKGGCIVFVPNSGGQTEIIDHPNLVYEDIKDAVQKIEMVLRDEKMQENLLRHLLLNSQKFSVENFQKEVRNIVSEFLSKK